jgi:mono/diheme cytochrome c family protein
VRHVLPWWCAGALCAWASAMAAESNVAVEQGSAVYAQYCESCHGRDMVTSSTLVFDLRKFPKDDLARFRASVLNGKGGMPAWRDTLSDEDVANLWAYVRSSGSPP